MSGKGDTPRPVDRKRYEREWERIFRKPRILRRIQAEGHRMWTSLVPEYSRMKRAK